MVMTVVQYGFAGPLSITQVTYYYYFPEGYFAFMRSLKSGLIIFVYLFLSCVCILFPSESVWEFTLCFVFFFSSLRFFILLKDKEGIEWQQLLCFLGRIRCAIDLVFRVIHQQNVWQEIKGRVMGRVVHRALLFAIIIR